MSSPVNKDAALAVLLRRAQWLLDDAAHALPAGRCTDADRESLAEALSVLAEVLLDSRVPIVVLQRAE